MGTANPEFWCWECRDRITYKGTGRRPKYRSAACRQGAYARRRREDPSKVRRDPPPNFELPSRPVSLDEIIFILRLLERKFTDDLVFRREGYERYTGRGASPFVRVPGGATVEDVHAAIARLRAQVARAAVRGIESHHHYEDDETI